MASEEKTIDRSMGTRIASLFQLLEKSLGRIGTKKESTDDLTQIRYVTSKLYNIVIAQDKVQKDLLFKESINIELLVNTLQSVYDDQVVVSVVSILSEILGKAPFGKRASLFVNHGVSNALFHLLRQASGQDNTLPDEVLLTTHCILGRIGNKDRKFAVKARLNNALLLTLGLIKNNHNNFKNLQYLLQVFKIYTGNSVNASYVGKHNSINILFRIIALCGRKHTAVLKLALDSLNNLTKSKSNSARSVGMGGVPTLLSLFTDWHQFDTKHRYNNLKKSILNTLKNITNLKSGRKALLESEGIRILYEICQDLSECREMESLILLASIIMRKCCPRNKLPLDNVNSVVTFALPLSDKHVPDCLVVSNQDIGDISDTGNDSDHSSLDNDDDIDSDDERFRTDNSDEPDDDQIEALEQPESRSIEELKSYSKFFPELFHFENRPGSCVSVPATISDPVLSKNERDSRFKFGRRVQSFSNITETLPKLFHNNSSTNSESDSVLYQLDKLSFRGRYSMPDVNYSDKQRDSATAVNLKTGTSVFMLDVQLPTSSKPAAKPPTPTRNAKKSKTGKRNGQSKEKRSKKKVEEPTTTITDAMCITPLPTPRGLDEADVMSTTSTVEPLEEEVFKDPELYTRMAGETKSVYRFEKIAYPDLQAANGSTKPEKLYNRKFGVQRSKVFEDIDRMIHPDLLIERVVFDLNKIVEEAGHNYCQQNSNLTNRDEFSVGRRLLSAGHLIFNAQFESANLRRAIQIREYEYDLILNPDINTNHHHQWFYFQVSNMVADVPYRFNIVNCEKLNSQFNFGMKPVMYSVADGIGGNGEWVRVGTDICYYKNHFIRSSITTGGVKGKSYYTSTFTITFKHSNDICYLAYHYPYTYTTLKTHLYHWESICDTSQIFFRHQKLCETLASNPVPVLTITAQPSIDMDGLNELKNRPYIFLSGRVHPGESNSSWVMKGTIDYLLSMKPGAQRLREMYIFKIVPMLNPDGVINGNSISRHRLTDAIRDHDDNSYLS
ncbi:cytosolic carboxypeptidase 1 [Patella vulgata]|uniref:cytosolic carboxypeptidase 1 n=1 Tax=Patella vulgata TaxID=6465 RepID=UPI00217F516F|nr:cytosolic carboxypeptidase 1 [Patella vulgata]